MGRRLPSLAALFLLPLASTSAPPLIAVDVGHYRERPGAASAHGVPEFDFNLALAQAVAAELARAGLDVRLIGADGRADDLHARAPQAAGAQLLLSVHHDSVQPRYLRTWRRGGETLQHSDRFRGFSLFVSRRNPQEARSLHCAERIGHALRHAGFAPTRHHAEPIDGERRPWADFAAGVHYYDELVVLRTASVPAVLLEAGVIVNRQEARLLSQPARRTRLAAAVAAGIRACLPD